MPAKKLSKPASDKGSGGPDSGPVCEPTGPDNSFLLAMMCVDPGLGADQVCEDSGPGMSLPSQPAWSVDPGVSEDPLMSTDPSLDVCEDVGPLMSTDPSLDVCEDAGPLMSVDPALEAERQARLDQAETDRESLTHTMDSFEQLPQASRDLVAARVAGLEGDALVREMEMINRALEGPNADRSLHALAGIEQILQDNPDAAERLDADVIEMMVDGVAERRTDSDRGEEGVLGARRVREAATALVAMDDDTYTSTRQLLDQAGQDADGNAVEGADDGTEQALILKAVAARGDAFADPTRRQAALDEVTGFGEAIRGNERGELIRRTTLLDIDDENTSTIDPDNIAANNDTLTDNDGLFQRFTDSCAPTTGQIIRGEIDPVFALQVHDEGLNSADPTNTTSTQQQTVLETGGGTAVARMGTQARDSMGSTMDSLEGAGTLTAGQRDAVERMTQGTALTPEDQATADAALAAVRAANGGHPTDQELAVMISDAGQTGSGMSCGGALNAVNDPSFTTNGTAAGPSAADLDSIEANLFEGENVGFRIANGPGHAMSIADVRRDEDGNRSFLVNDPWSGATRWVSDADFQSGAFSTNEFDLGASTVSHYYTEDD